MRGTGERLFCTQSAVSRCAHEGVQWVSLAGASSRLGHVLEVPFLQPRLEHAVLRAREFPEQAAGGEGSRQAGRGEDSGCRRALQTRRLSALDLSRTPLMGRGAASTQRTWRNTRSFRLSAGVASTIPSRLSFLVETMIGECSTWGRCDARRRSQ